jgi:hypothetical protein
LAAFLFQEHLLSQPTVDIFMATTNTIFDQLFSDVLTNQQTLSESEASRIFHYFKNNVLFRWRDANNDCEDRANAICILLDKWGIPNAKAWVFGGGYLRRDTGYLTNGWAYHVAAALPVAINEDVRYYVIDPATGNEMTEISEWASRITETPASYHLIKEGKIYIFNPASLAANAWHPRDRQNYKWTIQGLAGINGVSKAGKARLVFHKKLIADTEKKFKALLSTKPAI